MGDPRRFDLFADFVDRNFTKRDLQIADIASGNGKLHGALKHRGFSNITSWDKRKRNAGPRHMFKYGYFDYRNAPRGYEVVVGMHPDQASDHCVMYAAKHRVPFVICPCCVLPSAMPYQGYRYEHWLEHLERLAVNAKMRTVVTSLPMSGRNIIIAGWPK
jgi:hypothetical protein